MKFSEVVREVVRLGNASLQYWDSELPKYHPQYPIIRAEDKEVSPPPEAAEIEALLRSLPEKQLYSLMLLAYLGRGDFDAGHLKIGLRRIKENFPENTLVIAQLMAEQTLSEYLTDAMEEVHKRHIDLDELAIEDAVTAS